MRALNVREKVLLCLACFLGAIFCGIYGAKVIYSNFAFIFTQQNPPSIENLNPQQNKLDGLKISLQAFQNDENAYLNAIYSSATQNAIIFKKIQNSQNVKQNYIFYTSEFEFEAPFYEGLNFFKTLEYTPLHFFISNLSISKNEKGGLIFKARVHFARIL